MYDKKLQLINFKKQNLKKQVRKNQIQQIIHSRRKIQQQTQQSKNTIQQKPQSIQNFISLIKQQNKKALVNLGNYLIDFPHLKKQVINSNILQYLDPQNKNTAWFINIIIQTFGIYIKSHFFQLLNLLLKNKNQFSIKNTLYSIDYLCENKNYVNKIVQFSNFSQIISYCYHQNKNIKESSSSILTSLYTHQYTMAKLLQKGTIKQLKYMLQSLSSVDRKRALNSLSFVCQQSSIQIEYINQDKELLYLISEILEGDIYKVRRQGMYFVQLFCRNSNKEQLTNFLNTKILNSICKVISIYQSHYLQIVILAIKSLVQILQRFIYFGEDQLLFQLVQQIEIQYRIKNQLQLYAINHPNRNISFFGQRLLFLLQMQK